MGHRVLALIQWDICFLKHSLRMSLTVYKVLEQTMQFIWFHLLQAVEP